MIRLLLLLIAVGLTACNDRTKPNIIVILADDMGYGDVGCYNAESRIRTPHIDGLAAQGMRFTDAHSPSSVCTPSRYGLLTGRYCWRTRCKAGVLPSFAPPLIEAGRVTVASFLRQSGYATACIGKWHLGFTWTGHDGKPAIPKSANQSGEAIDFNRAIRGGPVDLGFDYFFGILGSLDWHSYFYIENAHTVGLPSLPKTHEHLPPRYREQQPGLTTPGWRDDRVDIDFVNRSVTFINRHVSETPDKPFFLYLPLHAPHVPYDPPQFAKGQSKAGRRGDMCQVADWAVGQIMRVLDERGIADDTLLVFTSDNGPLPGDRRELREGESFKRYGHPDNYETFGHRAAGSYRGGKFSIYEGGHRVPFVVRWPGKVEAGTTSAEVVCLTDLLPTFAGVLGASLPAGAAPDGYDILPVLLGRHEGKEPLREATVLHSSVGQLSIRKGDWKAVMGRLGAGDGSGKNRVEIAPQLYNVRTDPTESDDVVEQNPQILQDLTELLDGYVRRGDSQPGME